MTAGLAIMDEKRNPRAWFVTDGRKRAQTSKGVEYSKGKISVDGGKNIEEARQRRRGAATRKSDR